MSNLNNKKRKLGAPSLSTLMNMDHEVVGAPLYEQKFAGDAMETLQGETLRLKDMEGKVILVVNVATQ